jgi:hypothetical protein
VIGVDEDFELAEKSFNKAFVASNFKTSNSLPVFFNSTFNILIYIRHQSIIQSLSFPNLILQPKIIQRDH